jgi:hypothetical protein
MNEPVKHRQKNNVLIERLLDRLEKVPVTRARPMSTIDQTDIRVLPTSKTLAGTHDIDPSGAASIL